ncbi:hypothetical protein MTO96_037501 [Rhipicephalus appendiculatus]
MHLLIDYSKNPCYDFHGHVCHLWQQKAAAGAGVVSFLRNSTIHLLKHINTSLSIVDSLAAVSRDFDSMALFYRSCERFVSAPVVYMSDVLRPFRNFADEVLDLSTLPDVLRYIVELSLARGIHTVLDIRLVKFPDGVFLRILRGQTLSQKMDAQPALLPQDYLEELFHELSHSQGLKLNRTVILGYERILRTIMERTGRREQKESVAVLDQLNMAQLFSFFKGLADYGVVYLYIQILVDGLRFDYLRRVKRSDSEYVVSSCLQATRLVMRNARDVIMTQLFPEEFTDASILPLFTDVVRAISGARDAEIDDAFLLNSNVLHDALSNSVVVPASLRREPIFYESDVPPEFTMGSLGVLLARALLYAVITANSIDLWSSEEKVALLRYEQCMDERARSAFNVSLRYRHDQEPAAIYIWAQSARTAYDALVTACKEHPPASDLDSYWNAAQKAFFMRFCLLSCGVESELQRLASEVFCFLPLLNMEEFAKVFRCRQPPSLYSGAYCVL